MGKAEGAATGEVVAGEEVRNSDEGWDTGVDVGDLDGGGGGDGDERAES